jgi:hypothetical protein
MGLLLPKLNTPRLSLMKYLSLAFILFAHPVAALPAPSDLNRTIPQHPKSKALISSDRLSAIAGESCQAIRHGVEPEFIKGAIIYQGIIASPTRSYFHSEARKLADDIYTQSVAKCQLSTTTATK